MPIKISTSGTAWPAQGRRNHGTLSGSVNRWGKGPAFEESGASTASVRTLFGCFFALLRFMRPNMVAQVCSSQKDGTVK
jgi:hypothetical protein